MQKKSAKLTVISIVAILILAPIFTVLQLKFFSDKSYYISAAIIIVLAMIPFFVFYENRKIKTSEIVLCAMMIAICVSSRAIMAFIPQVKATCAIVIVTAIAFGPNVGFITGSLSMFVSNFFFGQGMFTPFQMLGMGLTGFFCGFIFYKKSYNTDKILVSVVGGVICFFVYGFIVDSCSVLMMLSDFTLKSVVSIYASGVTFNLIHAITTGMLLFFINKPMTDKFTRLRIKYGIFELE